MSEQSSSATSARVPLQRALQQVIIPDLVKRRASVTRVSRPYLTLTQRDQDQLAHASVLSTYAIESALEALLAQGWPLEQVYLEAIAGTARLLGQWWISDQLDFATLTLATGRLQELVRQWESRFVRSAEPISGADQFDVMLLSEFNDQHSLGVLMLQSFFKRDGWRVRNTWGMSESAMLQQVRTSQVHLIGLSLCTDRHLSQTRRVIGSIRQHSLNPGVLIMLGGPLVLSHPEMAQDLGADWLATHADLASREAFSRVTADHRIP